MTVDALRFIERAHAIVAWIATAGLVAAAWLALRFERARRATIAVLAAVTAFAMAASGLGLALHDAYRARLRQRLFVEAPQLGWLFERKHHAAFAATFLAVSALASFASVSRTGAGAPESAAIRKSALVAWIASAVLALAAAIASTIVARRAHF